MAKKIKAIKVEITLAPQDVQEQLGEVVTELQEMYFEKLSEKTIRSTLLNDKKFFAQTLPAICRGLVQNNATEVRAYEDESYNTHIEYAVNVVSAKYPLKKFSTSYCGE